MALPFKTGGGAMGIAILKIVNVLKIIRNTDNIYSLLNNESKLIKDKYKGLSENQ